MSTFFNLYEQEETTGFRTMVAVPKTNDLLIFGRKGNRGLIARCDESGKILWERLFETPGRKCFFVQGWPVGGEGFMVLGSIDAGVYNRRRHLLIRITPGGDLVFAREIYDGKTRNSLRLTPTNAGGFFISGWDSYGPDRIGVEFVDYSGNAHLSRYLHFQGDDQLYDATAFQQSHLLFVGGTSRPSGWNGFVIRANYEMEERIGHVIRFPGNIVEEIDCVTTAESENFVLGGHTPKDIFITQARYEGSNLLVESPRMANLNAPCKLRKIIFEGRYVYALGYYRGGNFRHFVVKFDLYESNANQSKLWIKTFSIDSKCYLTDIYTHTEGFYLCGFKRDASGYDTPLLVKTDKELDCCLTEAITTDPLEEKPPHLEVDRLEVQAGFPERSNAPVELPMTDNTSEQQALCPPPNDKGSCPLAFVGWNALEPRARTRNFERSLEAPVRDGMWMLSRQWQWGEFNGDDGGSIVYSKLSLRSTQLNRYTQLYDPLNKPFDKDVPLEFQVERTEVDITQDYLLRLEAGNYWLKLLRRKFDASPAVLQQYEQGFTAAYAFKIPEAPEESSYTDTALFKKDYVAYAQLRANEDAWMILHAAQGRSIDGKDLLEAIDSHIIFDHSFVDSAHSSQLQELLDEFSEWYLHQYRLPAAAAPSWSPNHLEHQFQCRAPHPEDGAPPVKLKGKEYPGGQLDWYAVDLSIENTDHNDDTSQTFNEAVTDADVDVLIPAKLNFPGMPAPRWWEMEDHQIDFGNLLTNTTDISKLLLLDFIIHHAGNWYILPHRAEVGSLTEIEGIEVKDNFGVRTLIQAANKVDQAIGGSFQKWSLFQLTQGDDDAQTQPDSFLFLAPVIPNILEGKPIEQVNFIRDETANMVWGIEEIISNELTAGQKGREASMALRKLLLARSEPAPPPPKNETSPPLRYQLATTVPENFIPFIPVHTQDSHRSIQLQRAAMPRIVGDFDNNIIPRTTLLNAYPTPYYIHEEEVPKRGQIVSTGWQRARWFGGKTVVWYGKQKRVGRGGGTSGLQFDQVEY